MSDNVSVSVAPGLSYSFPLKSSPIPAGFAAEVRRRREAIKAIRAVLDKYHDVSPSYVLEAFDCYLTDHFADREQHITDDQESDLICIETNISVLLREREELRNV